jgi:hypothetical protein
LEGLVGDSLDHLLLALPSPGLPLDPWNSSQLVCFAICLVWLIMAIHRERHAMQELLKSEHGFWELVAVLIPKAKNVIAK